MQDEPSVEQRSKLQQWLGPILICTAVLAVYGRCTTFAFTNWDDSKFLLQNPVLEQHNGDTFKQLWQPGSIPEEQLYIPVTYLSYWLESAVFGLKAAVCHTLNVVLHLANCLLLFALLSHLRLKRTPALLAVLLFAVHPLQAEAVSWCMGRKDLLATLFSFGSVLLLLVYSERTKRWQLMIPVGLLAALAMLAKPSALVLPAILAVLAWYKLVVRKREVIVCICSLIVIAASLYFLNGSLAPPVANNAPTLVYRLLVAPSALFDALLRFALLKPVSPYYEWPTSTGFAGAKTLLVAIGFAAVVFAARRKQALLAPALTLSFAALPVMGALVQHRKFFGADRYLYLPFFALAWFIAALLNGLRWKRRSIILGIICCWLAIASVLAFRASGVWRSSLTLWGPISAQQPRNSTAHNNLANALDAVGKVEESVQAYHRATEADPENDKAWSNLADAYRKLQKYDDAISAGKKALELNPGYYEGHHNLGLVYLRAGKPVLAAKHFRDALKTRPDAGPTRNLLGAAFVAQNQPKKAIVCFRKALDIEPDNIMYRLNLARALAGTEPAAALRELEIILQREPSNPTALQLKSSLVQKQNKP